MLLLKDKKEKIKKDIVQVVAVFRYQFIMMIPYATLVM